MALSDNAKNWLQKDVHFKFPNPKSMKLQFKLNNPRLKEKLFKELFRKSKRAYRRACIKRLIINPLKRLIINPLKRLFRIALLYLKMFFGGFVYGFKS